MALSFQAEPFALVQPQMDRLTQLHYEELTRHKEVVKLNPMLGKYAELERSGVLRVYTAREEEALVGYAFFFLHRHLHYADLVLAMNDLLFVDPQHRGSAGVRLIKFCERELTQAGAHKIVWHAKPGTLLVELLGKMGYQSEEIMLARLTASS